MAGNDGFVRDAADNDADDWFELYNPGAAAVNLQGWGLVDNTPGAAPFIIPPGYSIPAGGRLLVWADNETGQNTGSGQLHVDFKLDASGESITLFAPDASVVDTVTFGPQAANISSGRTPDGGNVISALTAPTPGAANTPAAPAPDIVSLSHSGNQLILNFSTVPGFSYQMQSSDDLISWLPAGNPAVAGGATMSLDTGSSGTIRKYFRVIRIP
jgi:hypothetical protein